MNERVKKYKIILASKSPRRREILTKAGYDFDIVVSSGELDIIGMQYNDELLYKCVNEKYNSINGIKKGKYNERVLIICADTVVVLDDMIIGKPKDKEDAIKILTDLSGKIHFVATGIQVVILEEEKIININKGIEKTKVKFRNLTNDDILGYVGRCKPFDKAGAYGIQDVGFDFVEKIEGNMDNVIGFPMTLFENLITCL